MGLTMTGKGLDCVLRRENRPYLTEENSPRSLRQNPQSKYLQEASSFHS